MTLFTIQYIQIYTIPLTAKKKSEFKNELLNYFKLNHKDLKQNRRSTDVKM